MGAGGNFCIALVVEKTISLVWVVEEEEEMLHDVLSTLILGLHIFGEM